MTTLRRVPLSSVINEALAHKYFANRDPLGKQIDVGGKDTRMLKPYTVVGVLADQVDKTVGRTMQPFILIPQEQIPTTSLFYQGLLKDHRQFRCEDQGTSLSQQRCDPSFIRQPPALALDNFQTMHDLAEQNTFSQRLGLYRWVRLPVWRC